MSAKRKLYRSSRKAKNSFGNIDEAILFNTFAIKSLLRTYTLFFIRHRLLCGA
ncbi:hypothetical protein HMPREF1981_02731 [Bacteroides pyogenes F0041]|uniref:Uncharacterized protein n=1 Tax=Bacteroides pyogenes F0041 TaxID=1321819 RepID=U2DQP3_9BACE|nr:hypothetical protein HMPREF1981_02731 [Bacteroides pyogenes F0041]